MLWATITVTGNAGLILDNGSVLYFFTGAWTDAGALPFSVKTIMDFGAASDVFFVVWPASIQFFGACISGLC